MRTKNIKDIILGKGVGKGELDKDKIIQNKLLEADLDDFEDELLNQYYKNQKYTNKPRLNGGKINTSEGRQDNEQDDKQKLQKINSLNKIDQKPNKQKDTSSSQPKMKTVSINNSNIEERVFQPIGSDDQPNISAKSWAIFEGSQCRYIRGYKSNEEREIASLTKIMTCLLSLRLLQKFKLDASKIYFSVSNSIDLINGTSAELEEGDWILVEDLLFALMLPSGNDAAIVLAENFGCLLYFNNIGKSKIFQEIHSVDVTEDIYVRDYQKLFLTEMNRLAFEFNLRNTHFINPHGLSNKNNKSTASDMAKLTWHAMQLEVFRKIVTTKKYQAIIKKVDFDESIIERQASWQNTNILLDKGFSGVKTGVTQTAGGCLSSWYNLFIRETGEEQQLIVVVLGSSNQDNRFTDTIKLIDWYAQIVRQLNSQQKVDICEFNQNNQQTNFQLQQINKYIK